MNMKKKSKKVKKYAVGGDLRMSEEGMDANPGFDGSPSSLTFPFVGGGGGGGDDGSATGQVKAISKAAGRAGDYLSTAGEAIGSGGQGGVRPGFPPPSTRYEEGGSVKKKPVKKNMGGMMKYKKGGKVKVRGAGKAIKGVRPAKMVKMKGS
jgi:hypothetical protein